MNLIAPSNFIFAGLIGLVLLLYVLRLKRKPRVVSSTLLWHSALRDLQANAPWQKLRSSLLMWLQIAFLVLLTLALVRPAIKVLASGGQSVAIILDASASMNATDVRPSRFDSARAQAQDLIGRLSPGDGATIIQAGLQTRVLSPLSTDKIALNRALNGAQTQDAPCNLREAITLATSLLQAKRNGRIYIFSDGAVPPLNDLSTTQNVQFVRVGKRNDNVALTAMDVRRPYGNGAPQVFATLRNFSTRARTVNLELLHDADLVQVRPVTLAPGAEASQVFEDLAFPSGLFSLKFDLNDDLQTDNAAYATLAPPQALRVLLLSPDGNLFLERALNLDPNVQVFRGGTDLKNVTGRYDVVVCDGIAPKNLPATNQLVFQAQTDLAPVVPSGVVQNPSAVDYDRKHPVTRFAPWNDVRFAQAQAVSIKPWAQAIVEGERTPLVVAGERDGRRVVWCGFALRDTDLPLKVTFPIFVINSLRWLTAQRGVGAGAEGAARRAGDAVSLNVPSDASRIAVAGPNGLKASLDANAPVFSDTSRAGLYTATSGKWSQSFGINLLNRAESDLAPRDALQVNGGPQVKAESRARANRELWGYLAFCALGLLGLEWWIYHRGT